MGGANRKQTDSKAVRDRQGSEENGLCMYFELLWGSEITVSQSKKCPKSHDP